MSVDDASEQPRPPAGAGFSDAVTFSFGDAAADVYGVARVGLATGPEGPAASGLVFLFAGGQPVAVRADGGLAVAEPTWESIAAAGVRTTIDEPLRAWTVSFTAEDASTSFTLRFEALAEPAELPPAHPAAEAGGMAGYESYCRVTGTVIVAGAEIAIDGAGQRGHSWGAPDWERLELARTLSVWADDGLAISLVAIREQGTRAHDAEQVAAFVIEPDVDADGEPISGPLAHLVEEPLLSTTYDGEGRQRAAGLELYVDEDSPARRAAGEVVCGTTLDLGRLRLDCAFFRWRIEGREGVGRYDILRRT